MQFHQALAFGAALAALAAGPALGGGPEADWAIEASSVSMVLISGKPLDYQRAPLENLPPLLVVLDHPQNASRFNRSGPQAALALGPGRSLFVQSQKFKQAETGDAPRGPGVSRGRTYSVGLALRW